MAGPPGQWAGVGRWSSVIDVTARAGRVDFGGRVGRGCLIFVASHV